MPTMMKRYAVLAALAAGAGIMACKGKENYADTTSAAGALAPSDSAKRMAGASTGVGASANAANANSAWSNPRIIAYATAANNAEIAEGSLAERKATNAAVKAFAKKMVTDHRAMLQDGKSLASKLNISPDTTADAVGDMRNTAQDQIKDLTQKKAGKDWDEDYIDKQIDDHKDVLGKLQDAEKTTTDPQLKDMLTKAIGKVQEHLTMAQDIKDNKLKS